MSRGTRPHLVGGRDVEPARTRDFREVMLPHLDAAYSYARYLTRDPHRAEDIVQDAFVRALRGFDGWRGEAPRAWLFAIVRNCFLAAGPSDYPVDPATAVEPVDPDDPERLAMEEDEAAMLRRTIAALPEPFRETLVLREQENLPYKEIATLTRAPIGTVMSRLARARAILADKLLGSIETTESRS